MMRVNAGHMWKHKIWGRFQVILLFTTAALLSGCIGSSSPAKPTYYYTLDYEAPAVTLDNQLPCILRVERFSVSPPYQSQRIIYAGSGTRRNSYAFHQWIAGPGELLPYFLVRDLRHTNGFKAVLTPDTSLSATHSLHGWVEEFVEKDDASGWQAVATVHISLINNLTADPTQKIMLQKRYHAAAPCKSKTPSALAAAMSAAVAQISSDAAKDIHHQLSTTRALKY